MLSRVDVKRKYFLPGSFGKMMDHVLIIKVNALLNINALLSQLGDMILRWWYLSHGRPAKAQANLRIRAVSPEPSLFAHIKYWSRRRVQPKIRHLAPLGMPVWKMNLQRTRSSIISCDGSYVPCPAEVRLKTGLLSYRSLLESWM